MSAGGECEAAVTARTRCKWIKFMEYSELLCDRFYLRLKRSVYESYLRLAMLYGSEAWCLKKSEVGISWTDRSTVRAVCVGFESNHRSFGWYRHVLRRENGNVLRRALDF